MDVTYLVKEKPPSFSSRFGTYAQYAKAQYNWDRFESPSGICGVNSVLKASKRHDCGIIKKMQNSSVMPQKQPRLSFVACRLSSKEDRFSRVPEKTPLFWFYYTCEVSSLFLFVWLFVCLFRLFDLGQCHRNSFVCLLGMQTVIQGRLIFKSAWKDDPFFGFSTALLRFFS